MTGNLGKIEEDGSKNNTGNKVSSKTWISFGIFSIIHLPFFCCFRVSLFWCSRTYVRNKVGIYFSVSRSCCISSQRPMPSWTVPQIVKPLLALVSMSESPSPYVWGNMWAGDRHHWDGRNKTCVQGCFCCCFCIHTFSILSMQKCCHVVLLFCP